MNRRQFGSIACAAISGLSTGCVSNTLSGNETTSTSNESQIVINGVYPHEIERTFFDYEYVEIKNTGATKQDISEYQVRYNDQQEYTVPDITLEPGAVLIVSSRSGENTVLERSPPIYLNFAGFGTGKKTSVLQCSGTVELLDSKGNLIDKMEFSKGCDK